MEPAVRNRASGEVRHTTARVICQRLWDDFDARDNLAEFAALTSISDLAGFLGADQARRAISPPQWLEKTREYLDAYSTRHLGLSQLSHSVQHHPTHISREFRRYYGKTLVQFVRERRVLRARDMLLLSDHSIADISIACGFYDQSHFTNAFRRELGCTPAQFRAGRLRTRSTQGPSRVAR
jgi:AraC family transcriptional regulator